MKHTIKKKERNLKTDTLLMTLESCGLTFFVRIITFNICHLLLIVFIVVI